MTRLSRKSDFQGDLIDVESDPRKLMRLAHQMTRALSGRGSLGDAVQDIAQLCRTDRASIIRYLPADGVVEQIIGLQHQPIIINPDIASEMSELERGTLKRFMVGRLNISVIVLHAGTDQTDLLVLIAADPTWLNVLAQELPFIWSARQKGIVSGMINATSELVVKGAILGSNNPYGLTPAEVQICIQLADGLKPKDITEQTGISMPTVRTHLRNIYAKTQLDGMIAVVRHLHQGARG